MSNTNINNNKKIKINNQVGGIKLGEGGFGCVIKPLIKCKNTDKKTKPERLYISKINRVEDENLRYNELQIYKLINKFVKNSNMYYINLIDSCALNHEKLKTENRNNLSFVKYFKRQDSNNTEYDVMNKTKDEFKNNPEEHDDKYCKIDNTMKYYNDIFEFGGYDMRVIIKNDTFKHIRELLIKQYKQIFYHLLQGLYHLHKIEIAHRDIKPLNILLYEKDNVLLPRYIDFGLSTDVRYILKHKDYNTFESYGTQGYIPLDIKIIEWIAYLHYEKNVNVFNSSTKWFIKNELIKSYNKYELKLFTDEEFNEIYEIILNELSVKSKTLFPIFAKKYVGILYKSDVYALGITFKYVMKRLEIKNVNLQNLINKMTEPNLLKRYTVQDCINSTFFNNISNNFNLLKFFNKSKPQNKSKPNKFKPNKSKPNNKKPIYKQKNSKKQSKKKTIKSINKKTGIKTKNQKTGIKTKKNIYKTKQNQKGGKRLGSGGYGCVVKPIIKCHKQELSNPNKYVSKIEMIREHLQSQKYGEPYVHSKIKKYMKGYNKFFIINEQECEIKPQTVLNRIPKDFMTVSVRDKKGPDGKKYDVTNKMVLDKYTEEEQKENFCPIDLTKRYKNYIMLNAGQTLGYHIKHNHNIIKNNLKLIIKHLLIGIRKLHKLHIIHRDIKLDNILGSLNKSKKKITFKYIDYGLADKIIGLKQKYNNGERYVLFNGTKFYKPIDIFILKKMIEYHQLGHNIKDFNNFRNIINETKNTEDFKKSNKDAKNIKLSRGFLNLESSNISLNYNSDIFINDEDLIEIYKSFINSILNNTIFNDYTKVYSGIVYKADIYALGILFKQITYNLNINNELLNNLIKNMLQLNPYKRFSVNECLKHPYLI